ncbi:hypothetical protein GGF37_003883, partial [Kickxella alabastrina]
MSAFTDTAEDGTSGWQINKNILGKRNDVPKAQPRRLTRQFGEPARKNGSGTTVVLESFGNIPHDPFLPDNKSIAKAASSDAGIHSGNSDSDDPGNTAMFLDETEEDELKKVVPGTPMAFEKLGQLTVKSIRRQRVSQTPRRPPLPAEMIDNAAMERGRFRYADDKESPSKKGRGEQPEELTLMSCFPKLTLKPLADRHSKSTDVAHMSEAVLQLKASKRAGSILNKIRSGSSSSAVVPDYMSRPDGAERTGPASLKPDSRREKFVPIVLPNHTAGEGVQMLPVAQTGERSKILEIQKPAAPATEKPDASLIIQDILSEKSNGSQPLAVSEDSNSNSSGVDKNSGENADEQMCTPLRQPITKGMTMFTKTPRTEQRRRIDKVRVFFRNRKLQMDEQPEPEVIAPKHSSDNILVSFDNMSEHMLSGVYGQSSDQLSQLSSIRPDDSSEMLEQGNETNTNLSLPESSFFLSVTGKQLEHRFYRPVPLVLNREDPPRWPGSRRNSHSNLIDLSSRLNSTIDVLNTGLQGQLMLDNDAEPEVDVTELSMVVDAAERVGAQLSQRLADSGSTEPAADQPSGFRTSPASVEFEGQVRTLRETMLETKDIVFAIQRELNQQRRGQSSEESKLDDIVRLLGALDMRLHMLEDRQRQELALGQQQQQQQYQQQPQQQPQKQQQRSISSGSTKVYAEPQQQQDIISRIGQLVVFCMSRYPLMLIGALFIILLAELVIIGGLAPSMQS